MSVLKSAQDLQAWIAQGKSMEALDNFYADNVQVTEMPTGEVRDGKEAQRAAIQQWFGMVKEMHASGCKSITADETNQVSTAETWFDCTFADGNRRTMEEVAVQQWQDGKIVAEKFYYNMPGK